jgi:hypothetical protein
MSLYDNLVVQIQDAASENNDPLFLQNIPVFVTNAENRINQAVKLPVSRKSSTSFLQLGNKYLTTPTNYLSPFELAVIVGDEQRYLLLKDVAYIREMYPNTTDITVPKVYAQFDENTLILGPTPDDAYEVELHYYSYPDSILTTGTSWIAEFFPNVLFYACMVEAAVFMKSEEDIVKAYAEQYSVNMKLLKDYAMQKFYSGNYRN